jgi:SAM-dependent methyltransferase
MTKPDICDYEGSSYRTDFWEGRGRDYEDRVERDVLRRLLPPSGRRLLELGAGYGRITDEYRMFDQVVLLDFSFSQLQYARQTYGDDGFIYVAADAYRLPFRAGTFDAATMVRVLHHFADMPAFFDGLRRVLAPDANFVLEFANKRNLKAMLRYALRRQEWNPYDHDPVEFVKLNFDFHPAYIAEHLRVAGFQTEQRVPVSFFRLGLLKRLMPSRVLAGLDGLLQRTGWLVAPSVFTRNRATGQGEDHITTPIESAFVCPHTGAPLTREGDAMVNHAEGVRYAIHDGIYVFKDLD